MKDIKVSIIIPVYGVEKFIEQCLTSVFSQTYKNYECLIVDDCGKDKSIDIARDLISNIDDPSKYRIITRKCNGGLSAARNSGLKEAKGDYVFFLDSDDKLFPDSIEVLASLAKKYTNVDIVQGSIEVQNGCDYFNSHRRFAEFIDDANEVRRCLISGLPSTAWNKLIRRDFLLKNNIIFKEGLIHEDELFRWHLHKYARTLCYSPQNSYWYRTDNQNSIMKSGNQLRSLRSSIAIVKEILPEVKSKAEVEFSIYNLKLRKAARFVSSDDKKIITREINQLRKTEKMPVALYAEMTMWNLPLCMIKQTLILAICMVIRKIILLFSTKK